MTQFKKTFSTVALSILAISISITLPTQRAFGEQQVPATTAIENLPPEPTIEPIDGMILPTEADPIIFPEPVSKPTVARTLPLSKADSLAALVARHAAANTTDREADCLARAVYFESKGEPLAGRLAVAQVVMNRAASGRFPGTLCGVVKQPSQFSFVRGGAFPAVREPSQWREAVAIAHIAINDLWQGPATRALFFHAKHVSPNWNRTRLIAVGNHIFYR
jgi:N-acetylmuramoyl-L-alanine amidase